MKITYNGAELVKMSEFSLLHFSDDCLRLVVGADKSVLLLPNEVKALIIKLQEYLDWAEENYDKPPKHKKVDVLIDDHGGSSLTVWTDHKDAKRLLKTVDGVSEVFTGSGNSYFVYLDPRYDKEITEQKIMETLGG